MTLITLGLNSNAAARCGGAYGSKPTVRVLIEVEAYGTDASSLTQHLAHHGIFIDWAHYVREGSRSKVFGGLTCRQIRFTEIRAVGLVAITLDHQGQPVVFGQRY